MKLSDFEIRVLHSLIEGDPEAVTLVRQLESATVLEREYTGVGLFTKIIVRPSSKKIMKSNRYIEETPKLHLEHPDLSAGAGALLWFKDGFIETLECYTYEGDWPQDESLFTIST